jgi:hypothetical protein
MRRSTRRISGPIIFAEGAKMRDKHVLTPDLESPPLISYYQILVPYKKWHLKWYQILVPYKKWHLKWYQF